MAPSKVKPREARSRNGTPLAPDAADHGAPGSGSSPISSNPASYEDLLDQNCRASSPPASVTLRRIADALKICSDVARARTNSCDQEMRELSRKRQELISLVREQELAERHAVEKAERDLLAHHSKQADGLHADGDSRPPAIGAHSLARQDGAEQGSKPSSNYSGVKREEEALSPTDLTSPTSPHQIRPRPAVPQVQTFGEDPLTFEDPTIYHIRQLHDFVTETEKKDVLGVAEYPHSDLHDLTPGTPPDRDFSNPKLDNRVTASQFTNYVEPYVRPITQEDLAFLEERGDRSGPFAMPRRGARPYHEIWAEEDGSYSSNESEPRQISTNKPTGTIEQMSDEAAERGDVSIGPMMSRFLSLLRPERRAGSQSHHEASVNGEAVNGRFASIDIDVNRESTSDDQRNRLLPPSTSFAESAQAAWKNASSKLDYGAADERLKAELRYIGFLPEDAEPDYDGHHDDEIAARLRYLQEELQRVSILNGARKSRVLELANQQTAKQDWENVAEDLDTQLNQAFLKRHRNMGKSKKVAKRPGGAGGGSHPIAAASGVSKPTVGEPIRDLMERRNKWNSILGPIVNYGNSPVPHESIFDPAMMDNLVAKENEAWNEA